MYFPYSHLLYNSCLIEISNFKILHKRDHTPIPLNRVGQHAFQQVTKDNKKNAQLIVTNSVHLTEWFRPLYPICIYDVAFRLQNQSKRLILASKYLKKRVRIFFIISRGTPHVMRKRIPTSFRSSRIDYLTGVAKEYSHTQCLALLPWR